MCTSRASTSEVDVDVHIDDEIRGNRGFRVGVAEEPLHRARLADREFCLDHDPEHMHPDRKRPADEDDLGYYNGTAATCSTSTGKAGSRI